MFLHECLRSLNDQYLTATGGDSGRRHAHGDPLTMLERFVDAGWDVVAARTPTARYGKRRDERAVERCDVEFVTGDGLVRDTDRPREDWQHHVESWFDAEQYDWDPRTVETVDVDTPVAPADIGTATTASPGEPIATRLGWCR